MGQSGESNARELITRLINSIGARDDQGIVPFVTDWSRIVGADLAAHSRVLDVRNGAVVVGLDHPAWLQTMHFKQEKIVATIQRSYPSLDVRYLHMTVIDSLGNQPSRNPLGTTASADSPASDEGTDHPSQDPSAAAEQPEQGSTGKDPEFLQHLEGLHEALRRKEREDRETQQH